MGIETDLKYDPETMDYFTFRPITGYPCPLIGKSISTLSECLACPYLKEHRAPWYFFGIKCYPPKHLVKPDAKDTGVYNI